MQVRVYYTQNAWDVEGASVLSFLNAWNIPEASSPRTKERIFIPCGRGTVGARPSFSHCGCAEYTRATRARGSEDHQTQLPELLSVQPRVCREDIVVGKTLSYAERTLTGTQLIILGEDICLGLLSSGGQLRTTNINCSITYYC